MRNLSRTTSAGVLAVAIGGIAGGTNTALRAQAQSELRFEVASVRRVEIQNTDRGVPVFPVTGGIGTENPTRISYRATWLKPLIAEAFNVRVDQITGPAGFDQDRYDIVANIPEGATKDQFKVMLGNLLRDRFHLRFHMDSKSIPVYALRVAKNGPKFKETSVRRVDDATAPAGSIKSARDAQGFPVLSPEYRGMVSFPGDGELFTTAQDVPMADFARSTEQRAGRPVIDETGLKGRYDFRIHHEWFPQRGAGALASSPAPSIFSAVEEQLGLKLEPSTSSFPQLIIDSIEREPADN